MKKVVSFENEKKMSTKLILISTGQQLKSVKILNLFSKPSTKQGQMLSIMKVKECKLKS